MASHAQAVSENMRHFGPQPPSKRPDQKCRSLPGSPKHSARSLPPLSAGGQCGHAHPPPPSERPVFRRYNTHQPAISSPLRNSVELPFEDFKCSESDANPHTKRKCRWLSLTSAADDGCCGELVSVGHLLDHVNEEEEIHGLGLVSCYWQDCIYVAPRRELMIHVNEKHL